MDYQISKTINNTSIEQLRPKVEEELKKEGFGILTEIDIQATLKNTSGAGLLLCRMSILSH